MAEHGVILNMGQCTAEIDLPFKTVSPPAAVIRGVSPRLTTYPNNIALPAVARWGRKPPITAQPYAVENAAEVIMPRDEEFPLVTQPTTANAEESLFSPRIVDDAEIHYLRAISPEAQDEEYDPFAEPKITGPQFDEALSQNERAEENNQLQEQIPPMYHEFLDIFRQKEETEES